MTLLTKCGPQIWVCLFMFRTITLQQLNSLATIDTFSCFGGLEITHQTAMREVPDSIPGSDNGFYVWFVCFVVNVFLLFVQTHHFPCFLQFPLQC